MFFFFFSSRRRHTRCSRDWSSDVCSSDLVSRYRGQAVRPVAISVGLRPAQFGRRNARRVNSDEGVSSTQLRLGRILVHQLLRTAFFMESNGFHGGSLADCTSILSVPSASCL